MLQTQWLLQPHSCVAIDSKTGEAVPVNRILPETKQEKALFKETEARNSLRRSKERKRVGEWGGTNHQK